MDIAQKVMGVTCIVVALGGAFYLGRRQSYSELSECNADLGDTTFRKIECERDLCVCAEEQDTCYRALGDLGLQEMLSIEDYEGCWESGDLSGSTKMEIGGRYFIAPDCMTGLDIDQE